MRIRTPSSLLMAAAALFSLVGLAASVDAETIRYVAPEAQGEGSGRTADAAAGYRDAEFWKNVQAALDEAPVTVRFVDGTYPGPALYLINMGHDKHRLILRGDTDEGAIFSGDTHWYFRLKGSHHITFSHLHFRGPVTSFPIHMQEEGDRFSHHIDIEHCTFTDMHTVIYGALGITNGSHHVTVRNCLFRNVGHDGRAHMVYNTHHAHHLSFYDNVFQDCTGEYVRFRNGCENVEVARNVFRNTEPRFDHPFVSVTMYNDVDPGDEVFSNGIVIHDNVFEYHPNHPSPDTPDQPWYKGHFWSGHAIAFGNFGYSHPDYSYLLTGEQAEQLAHGPVDQRRQLLRDLTGIDLDRVRIHDNTYINTRVNIAFGTLAKYGAQSNGWEGFMDIEDLIRE